jgi:phage shock protein E
MIESLQFNLIERCAVNRFFLFCIILFTVVLPAFSEAAVTRNIDPQEAFALASRSSDFYLLDVRTLGEYQQARLKGARLIPIDQLAKRLAEVPKDRPILVYCAVGSRSAQAVNYLARQGYPELYNLDGGIYAWAQKGYPVLRGGP